MSLEAGKVRAIEQVLAVQDVELMNELRRLIDEVVREFDHQRRPPPPMLPAADFLRCYEAAEEAIRNGDTVSHEEVVARFHGQYQRSADAN